MLFTYNDEQHEGEISLYTAVLYEQEFSTPQKQADILRDMSEAIDKIANADANPLDSTSGLLKIASRVMWSAEATLKNNIPTFEQWSKQVKKLNCPELIIRMWDEMQDVFFHTAPTANEGAKQE